MHIGIKWVYQTGRALVGSINMEAPQDSETTPRLSQYGVHIHPGYKRLAMACKQNYLLFILAGEGPEIQYEVGDGPINPAQTQVSSTKY